MAAPTDRVSINVSTVNPSSVILLQTARATASARPSSRRRLIRILLDGGSQRTFIRKDVSAKLHCSTSGYEELTIFALGRRANNENVSRRVKVALTPPLSAQSLELEALEIEDLCMGSLPIPDGNLIKELSQSNMTLADDTVHRLEIPGISILIGCDYYWSVVTGKVRKLRRGLVAVETIFGWVLQGPTPSNHEPHAQVAHALHVQATDVTIRQELRRFWNVEHLGIEEISCPARPQEDPVLQQFAATTRLSEQRYTVRLPWKGSKKTLSDNQSLALKRLNVLTRKLRQSKALLETYDRTIRQYINLDHAERVNPSSLVSQAYYMPHHA
ncbi:uncharacterized protein LOC135395738 [Ornithodoros turicata]|uniref:uncharacterized protein LOC135395738 n=1 Tax=Ornithodoros turicata TaxID=34597 RepID=UPI003138B717